MTDTDIAQRLFELTTLYEVSRLLQSAVSYDQMSFDVLTAVMGLTGARWGIIWTVNCEECSVRPVQACGLSITSAGSFDLPPEWVAEFSQRSSPLLLKGRHNGGDRSAAGKRYAVPGWLAEYGPELILPLSASGKLCGLIALGPNFLNRRYESFLQDLLGSVGYLAGLALNRQAGSSIPRNNGLSGSVDAFRQRHPVLGRIVGEGRAALELYKQICTVAHASCTILLEGETGTGKQLVAEVIHKTGRRADGPFIEVDCGSVPETLIESELFGHVKGSFTGAHSDRKGVFELADGGTLFLDEVGNLPVSIQGRLLRVLQERRFRPVGGASNVEVDVRVIAATNRDLHTAVQDGTFREDLFYRLYVYPVRIPPLRERREDIPILAHFFLRKCAAENDLPVPELTDAFLERLQNHEFPGNIRELRHVMERVLLQAEGREVVGSDSLDDVLTVSPSLQNGAPGYGEPAAGPKGRRRDDTIRSAIPYRPYQSRGEWVVEVLKDHRFNIRAAAESLTLFARSGLMDVPPLTDRSSLTYYLQGECFRLFLEEDGNIDGVGWTLCPEDDEVRRIAVLKVQGYLDSAKAALLTCTGPSDARERLLNRFSKLPGMYRNVLLKLADRLWEAGERELRST